MRVGLDGFALHPLKLDAFGQFDYCVENGFAGVLLSGMRNLSADLSGDELRPIRDRADELGLFSHPSVYPVNPVQVCRPVEDVAADLAAQIEAAAACGWHELHSSLGADKERYELDTPWSEQLVAASRVLTQVAPVLREHGSRINLENHGDSTSFELARLAEGVGPDVVGICLDTANLLVFAENPVDAAERAAPYVHMTHAKDALVFFCDTGLKRQGRAVGQGCLDWRTILPILGRHAPDLHLSIEDHKWIFYAHIFQEEWLAQQGDLSRDELARTVGLAWEAQKGLQAGSLPDPDTYEQVEYADEMQDRLIYGRDYLNGLLQELELTD